MDNEKEQPVNPLSPETPEIPIPDEAPEPAPPGSLPKIIDESQ